MILDKIIHYIRSYMSRKSKGAGKTANLDELRVQLIPVTEIDGSTSERQSKILYLMANTIHLGRKRGRPTKMDRENDNAA